MNSKFLLSWLLIILGNVAAAQCAECKPDFPIGHYFVHIGAIVDARVEKVSDELFKLDILGYIKTSESELKSVKVSPSLALQRNEGCLLDSMIESGCRYVFFLNRLDYFPWRYVLSEPCNRFKIQSDSVYIGYEFLSGINGADSLIINQKNNYNDPLMQTGYKISLYDFAKMIEDVNHSFIPEYRKSSRIFGYPGRRKSAHNVIRYNYKTPNTNDKLTRAIISELKESWKL